MKFKRKVLFITLTFFFVGFHSTDWAVASGVKDIVKANNDFAVSLYGQLKEKDGNLFFSPFRISTALAMTYAGAAGKTAEQMVSVFHFELNTAAFHEKFKKLLEVQDADPGADNYEIKVANSLWFQKDFLLNKDFSSLLQNDYRSTSNSVDFKNDRSGSSLRINNWVDEKTAHKIKAIISPTNLSEDTRLILVNAIYFKGKWENAFKKSSTSRKKFYLNDNHPVDVQMMHTESSFKYFEDDQIQEIELPYKGERISMVILLPKERNGLAKLESQLTAGRLSAYLDGFRGYKKTVLSLPRFKTESLFDLAEFLIDMGMADAFDRKKADLSLMTTREEDKLFISSVLHKAFVEVNEKGTEAAAVTALRFDLAQSMPTKPVNPVIFTADHPFVFLIRDIETGSLLFMGRVVDPR